jgi:glycosyltransferase involved in cell wall biosynthesis
VSDAEVLRILHVMRAPVGGLFRHVVDLAREQADRGHAVGIIADRDSGGDAAAQRLAAIEPKLALGLSRVPMSRHVGPLDYTAVRHVAERARAASADVLHGHGAKGGAYVRLCGSDAIRVYTPHGGSLHFSALSPVGFAYLAAERLLKRRSDLVLFESEFGRAAYARKIGEPPLARVVPNGIAPAELEPIETDRDAADVLYIGELRTLKGCDVLLDALAILAAEGWRGHVRLYGEGPHRQAFETRAESIGLSQRVAFPGLTPAREAFRMGRLLVVPSRAESLPYIVLEAAGAQRPLVATNVGGIPEIFGPDATALVPPGDARALARAIRAALERTDMELVRRLHERVASRFSITAMAEGVLAAYRAARAARGRR